ncbi:lipopolysaccharide biosynthesis protein [Ureibacillus terrenus]|uniref:lipopolysaccharide biosynthesis protein n=1 Tax=Ureibacillus terrenus TaxID=118246 RepID=UPI002E204323|nr:lipopolysaccharide biosynthesis protein [Ureibacillus terrenus]
MKKKRTDFMNRFLNGSLWILASTILQQIVQFVLLIVLARLLTPSEFGVVTVSTILVSFFGITSQLGIPQALIQKKNLNKIDIRASLTILILSTFISIMLMYVFSEVLTSLFSLSELYKIINIVIFTVIIQAVSSIPDALLQRDLKYKETSMVESISYTIGYGGIGILLAYMDYGYYSLIYSNLTYSILKLCWLYLLCPFSLKPTVKVKDLNKVFQLSFGFFITRITSFFSLQLDNIVVGKKLGPEQLGIYSRLYQIITLPAKVSGMFLDRLLFSSLSRIQENKEKIKDIYLFSLSVAGFVLFPLSIFIYIYANEIIFILLGERWTMAVEPLRIFTISIFFRAAYKIGETIANSTGYVYSRIWRQIFYAASIFVFSLIGSKFGIDGVIVGINLSIILNFILITQLANKILKVQKYILVKRLVPIAIVSVVFYFFIKAQYIFCLNLINNKYTLLLIGGLLSIIFISLFFKSIILPEFKRLKR